MPIEIKELNIKININDSQQSNASANKKAGSKTDNVIEACIEQVMNIQNRKTER